MRLRIGELPVAFLRGVIRPLCLGLLGAIVVSCSCGSDVRNSKPGGAGGKGGGAADAGPRVCAFDEDPFDNGCVFGP